MSDTPETTIPDPTIPAVVRYGLRETRQLPHAGHRQPRRQAQIASLARPTVSLGDFRPLKSLTMTVRDLLQARRTDILRLAGKHGATDVRVFGSVARREADDASDIDFLVRMDSGRSLFDLGALLADLEELLGRPVDVVTERGLRARIREEVLRHAVPV